MSINLKLLRVQHGLTLEQVAQQTGLTRSYLSKVERGLSTPSIESASSIAKVLGVRVDRLLGRPSEEEDPVAIIRAEQASDSGGTDPTAMVAGLSPGRMMRAFVIRPSRQGSRGRLMSHHEGEEILYVLEGQVELQFARRKGMLSKGDCAQFDSTMPHRLIAMDDNSAVLVVIASAEDGERR